MLAVVVVLAAACSSDTGEVGPAPAGSSSSSPFTVGEVPEGYELISGGMGTRVGEWGDDSTGTVEPYMVLSPDGQATGRNVVRVAITGYEGYQGGLAQASLGYLSELRELEVGGAAAIYAPASTDARGQRWADLVVVRGEDLAVRVSSPTASVAELAAVARRVVVPDDRTKAPRIPDPPAGLRVVGSVDVDGQLAVDAFVAPHTDQIPGPRSAHALAWTRPTDESDRLSVLTVPGSSLDLSVVPVRERSWPHITRASRRRVIEGRPALILDEVWSGVPVSNRRTVMVEAAWGDAVVVTASGTSLPSEQQMIAVAATIRPTGEGTWDDLVTEANGGPGLHADIGRHELARGRIGDLEWLLQDGPPDGGMSVFPAAPLDRLRGVDPCLKLSDRTRACAGSLGGGGSETPAGWYLVATGRGSGTSGLSFVVLSTPQPAVAVRVRTASATATAALVQVPAGGIWGAVVFVSDPGFATCDPAVSTPSRGQMRMEALDSSGEVVRCLG